MTYLKTDRIVSGGIVAIVCLAATAAQAQCPNGSCPRVAYQSPAYRVAYQPVYRMVYPAYASPQYATSDPGGFVAWLNAHRARHGVGPVAYDPGLSADAAASNAAMRAYGFGHHVRFAPHNKNVGAGAFQSIQSQWAASPAHNAWLLRARVVGVAYDGYYATFSAY